MSGSVSSEKISLISLIQHIDLIYTAMLVRLELGGPFFRESSH